MLKWSYFISANSPCLDNFSWYNNSVVFDSQCMHLKGVCSGSIYAAGCCWVGHLSAQLDLEAKGSWDSTLSFKKLYSLIGDWREVAEPTWPFPLFMVPNSFSLSFPLVLIGTDNWWLKFVLDWAMVWNLAQYKSSFSITHKLGWFGDLVGDWGFKILSRLIF